MTVHKRLAALGAASLSIVLVAFTPQGLSQTAAGFTPGSFRVTESGAAEYRIPIKVPPGTAGMAPRLALVYNSQGGDGLLGVGWNLEGLSAITRCPRTLAQDGVRGGVNYDWNDRYCMDGQRLVLVSGTSYGAHGAEYRTERESFSKVISYGVAGMGPAWFKVWTKNGQIIEYGNTPDSRIEAVGKASVRVWTMNKVGDTKGNYYELDYIEDPVNGDFRPATIGAVGTSGYAASVEFTYQDRSNVVPSYLGGSVIKVLKRLAAIKTYVEAALVRDYRFAYDEAGAGNRARLLSLTECAGNGDCLPPTTLAWQGSAGGWPVSVYWTGPAPAVPVTDQCLTGDLNGDGITDMWCYSGNGQWHVALSQGTAWSSPPMWIGPAVAVPVRDQCLAGDLNGDGKTDMWCYGGGGLWYAALSTGTNWNLLPGQAGAAPAVPVGNQCLTGDLDGDARADMWCYGGGGQWYPALSTGTGWNFLPAQGGPAPAVPVGDQCLTGDLDGDGKTDMWCYGGAGQWYPALSSGTGWISLPAQTGPAPGVPVSNQCFTGDMNGDGKVDMWCYGGGGQWYLALSTGAGFSALPAQSGPAPAVPVGNQCLTGDLNGDGKTDMWCLSDSATNRWHVALSTGTGWDSASWIGSGPGTSVGAQCMTGDLDGDGKTDMWCYAATGQWHVTRPGHVAPDLISSINQGTGVATSVAYSPLTQGSVYTKDSDAVYPWIDLQLPLHVVSFASTSNGIGTTRTTNYTYGGAKASHDGRGSLGFRWVQSIEPVGAPAGLVTRSEHRQDWPYVGLTSQVRTSLGSVVLRQVDSVYGCMNPADGAACTSLTVGSRYFTYLLQMLETSNDANGTLVSKVRTTNFVDEAGYSSGPYGNVTTVSVEQLTASGASFGAGKTTFSWYYNNPANWVLGRLTKSQVVSTCPDKPGGPSGACQ